MTFGQMRLYTKRFRDIVDSNVTQQIKNERLATLMTDLERAFGIPVLRSAEFEKKHPFVIQLYRTVSEARIF